MEGLNQWFGQSKTGRFDNDVIDLRLECENLIECWDELVSNRAAQAAIGKLNNVLLTAVLVAAAL
jgi:hypothetical protein